MRVLITGASGLLGKALIETAPAGFEIVPVCSTENPPQPTQHSWYTIDITNSDLLKFFISQIKPNIIIHCAAVGSVDYTQKNYHEAIKVNLTATIDLATAAEKVKASMVAISTNAVYDGEHAPYSESAPLAPTNYYGVLKSAAEQAVRCSNTRWIIHRPILMYGWPNTGRRGNWVTKWIEMLKAGKECLVVDDTHTQPLYNYCCANAVWESVTRERYGNIYNLAGPEKMTLFDLATIVCEELGADKKLLKPVPSSYFPSIAPRPRDTTYDLSKAIQELDFRPITVRDGIRKMLANT
jgi:dTDP-4-dehydrorhamnose reductase